MIALTGNTITGIEVLKKSANALKRMSLQLSGNDAAILMDDYCLKHIERIFWNIFLNAGQACYCIKRIYVNKNIYPVFLKRLFEYAKTINVGNGFEPQNQLGALINNEQILRMNQYISDIKHNGGKVLTGGNTVDQNGYFFPPTITYDLNMKCTIISEEQFGPIIPIIPVNNITEAVNEANRYCFGLGVSIWSHNKEEATQYIKNIDVSQAWINMHGDTEKAAPFGGLKKSGFEIEHGMDLFSYAQTIHIPISD
jgi:acyl-CoA reductase-like NAD-dependent aldehyde dehydrogenase